MPPRNLAEARRLHPDLGFALYALEPRGAVTLEVLDGETSHTFVGVTEAEAWSAAFPGTAPDEPPEKRVDDLIHRGMVFRAADKVEQPGERKVYDLGAADAESVLFDRETGEPVSVVLRDVTLAMPSYEPFATTGTDMVVFRDAAGALRARQVDDFDLSHVPDKPANEPAPPAEPARAPSVFD